MKLKYFQYFILLSGLILLGTLKVQAASNTNSAPTNERISISKAHAYPNPFNNEREVTRIKFNLYTKKSLKPVSISVIIYDFNGKKVWTRRDKTDNLKPGDNNIDLIRWGGENDMGDRVANGLYYAKIIVEASNTKVKVIKILVK